MRIASVKVGNFRAIAGTATLRLGDMTALIGPSGSGKTTLLLAIERFFSRERGRMRAEDFNDPKRPVTVTVTLSPREGPGREVTCEWGYGMGKKSVQAPRYTSGGREIKRGDRPLGEMSVVHVPAEHETDADGEDKRNTLWERMIDGALRKKASLEADKAGLQKKFGEEYGERLGEIRRRINDKLPGEEGVGYAPNTMVSLEFAEPEVRMGTSLGVLDLDSEREVSHKCAGHGTKRAFHMSTLEVLSEMSAEEGEGGQESLTVMAIDEPGLHQHPQRQRVLLEALRRLSEDGSRQVVYSTHSPHFVTLKAPMSVRRVVRGGGGVMVHDGEDLGGAEVRGRVISAMEEAVFANGVVLVEGHTDEVILGAIFRKVSHGKVTVMEEMIKAEVAIAECGGKGNAVRFCQVLDSLGIKRFLLWDGDLYHKKKKDIDDTERKNKSIVGALGLDPGFLDALKRSADDGYAMDGGHVCFKFDGPTCFAASFRMHHKDELEAKIKGGSDIGADFDPDALGQTGFAGDVIPAIRRHLLGKGGA